MGTTNYIIKQFQRVQNKLVKMPTYQIYIRVYI